jgi:AraC-like DNA-binding protein
MGGRTIPWNRPTAALGAENALLRAQARTHIVRDFPGPLSIKCVTEGRVAWKIGGRELVVDPEAFLVLNAGEPYSMDIDSRAPVSTLCVFFRHGFVESVRASMIGSDPELCADATFQMRERLHCKDERIAPRMHALAAARTADRLWLEEQYLELACGLLRLERDVAQRLYRLPARRAATREELFRRVRRAQELLHACADADLDVTALARAACLSPYHFHRAFTCAFGRTPHQYRTALRLAKARRLLETTAMTVTRISDAVGFESSASFSLLYRRHFGVPPRAARKFAKSDKTARLADGTIYP